METVRFAPSPTGLLHLGHAYSAEYADEARGGGRFLLRIEDIDRQRVHQEFVNAIFEDLGWLGLQWEKPVLFQSERLIRYSEALEEIIEERHAYRCFCSRNQIATELQNMASAPHEPVSGYPGTCRRLSVEEASERALSGEQFAWRLDVERSLRKLGPITWTDRRRGEQQVDRMADPILGRRDSGTSYHLSSVIDDADQGVTLVTRGSDLFESTHIHRLIQGILGLRVPIYEHHLLVGDELGRRLSKRDHALSIRELRESGLSAEDVLAKARANLISDA